MSHYVRAALTGWGNYNKADVCLYRPEKERELLELLASKEQPNYISRGLGRSYGDIATNANGGVILHTRLNRFLSFDATSGIVECESGVTYDDLIRHLLSRGFFLPVVPGTKFVTIGGAIANDVHGKNHHQVGSIGCHIIDLQLLLASGETVHCSRESNAGLFWATVGGLGLTGVILRARIKLAPVESAYISTNCKRYENIDRVLAEMSAADKDFQYSVAWIDCLQTERSLGRSVLMRGNHLPAAALKQTVTDPFAIKNRHRFTLPAILPSTSLTTLTAQLFNQLYFRAKREREHLIMDYDSFLFPLDRIRNWNSFYGKHGFLQYQIVFPMATSHEGLVAVLKKLSGAKQASFLAVLKRCGNQGDGLLSFPQDGFSLALDMPARNTELLPLLNELDEIVLRHRGRVYLAKDARLSRATFEQMYPNTKAFKEIKRQVDPTALFSSSLSRRLGLTEV